jgi:ribose/xylose/arabinose/galactoside ABC-type transport system permease subunit
MNSKKTQGFFLLLVFVWLGTFFLNDGFASEYNSRNLIRYCSMFGIIGIGVMFVIVTGGIDLSIGSTIGLIGASLVLLIRLNPVESLKPIAEDDKAKVVCFFWVLVSLMVLASLGWLVFSYLRNNFRFKKALFPLIFLSFSILSLIALSVANSDAPNTTRIPWIFFLLFSISIHIGLLHGVLITQFQLQPFVVTLGGLLCYRGLIRWLTNDTTQGLGSTFDGTLQLVAKGEVCTVSTLMLFVGFGTALYYALSMMTTKNRTTGSFHTQVVGISIGAIIGLIGSSRFWGGFERTDFVELFKLSNLGIPFQF